MKKEILLFDQYLSGLGISFEAVVIGGAALNIMGIISRETRDVDFLDPEIPEELKKASIDFAKKYPELKLNPKEWINNGPQGLKRDLPKGWSSDLQIIFRGRALILKTLGRLNLLRTKLYACASRDIDYQDCLALNPTAKELDACKEWVMEGDASEFWPRVVEDVFARLKKDLDHE